MGRPWLGGRHSYGIYNGSGRRPITSCVSIESASSPKLRVADGPKSAQKPEKVDFGDFGAGGPIFTDFGPPPMTARTRADRFYHYRSLTVVYRGGPGAPPGPQIWAPGPSPDLAVEYRGGPRPHLRRTRCASGIKPQNNPIIGGHLPRDST